MQEINSIVSGYNTTEFIFVFGIARHDYIHITNMSNRIVPTLYYLPLRARAEPLRMMFEISGIDYKNENISLQDWPMIKPTMPKGYGAEYPGREPGNRALPVLRIPNINVNDGEDTLMPESRDIARWIAEQAGPVGGLLPLDTKLQEECKDMFDKSQSLPMFWPTALLMRFDEDTTNHILFGKDLPDVPFGENTTLKDWMSTQHGFDMTRKSFKEMETILKKRHPEAYNTKKKNNYNTANNLTMPDAANYIKHDNIFFGGESPHYGEIGLFVQVNNLITLIGEDNAFKGFSALWRNWYYQMSKIPGIDNYVKTRPNNAGYPGSVLKLYGDDGLFSKNESDNNMKENIFTKGA